MDTFFPFRSQEGLDRIRSSYQKILEQVPCPQRLIPTPYGNTFILEAGASSHAPLILLHGFASNSASWLVVFPVLAPNYHVLAADTPGEPGNSDSRRMDLARGETTLWLRELLDTLTIDQAILVGNSLGGWMALRFASAFPERVAALSLLAPSGLVQPKESFQKDSLRLAQGAPDHDPLIRSILGDAHLPQEVLDFMNLIMTHFIPYTGPLPLLSDQELSVLSMPVLYLSGTDDATMDAAAASDRLKQAVPHAEIHLTDKGHLITATGPLIADFLRRNNL